jgi:hypothetical protein
LTSDSRIILQRDLLVSSPLARLIPALSLKHLTARKVNFSLQLPKKKARYVLTHWATLKGIIWTILCIWLKNQPSASVIIFAWCKYDMGRRRLSLWAWRVLAKLIHQQQIYQSPQRLMCEMLFVLTLASLSRFLQQSHADCYHHDFSCKYCQF